MIDRHVWRLRNRHRDLSRMLREEEGKLRPDPFVVQDLKRRKLQVKDELQLAEAGLLPVTSRMSGFN